MVTTPSQSRLDIYLAWGNLVSEKPGKNKFCIRKQEYTTASLRLAWAMYDVAG